MRITKVQILGSGKLKISVADTQGQWFKVIETNLPEGSYASEEDGGLDKGEDTPLKLEDSKARTLEDDVAEESKHD